jgi:sec-independent protein translocase protein TatC
MPKTDEEDLFEGTTMTFGEHLEELRICLFRALVGLVIGFLIGLFVAKYVVHLITFPLKGALDTHFEIVSEEELRRLYGDELQEDLKEFMKRERLLYEEVYLERDELLRLSALPSASATREPVAEDPPHEEQSRAPDVLSPAEKGTPAAPGDDAKATPEGDSEAAPEDDAAAVPEDGPTAALEDDSSFGPDDDPSAPAGEAVLPAPKGELVKARVWRKASSEVKSLSSQEPFMIWLKAGFFTGLLIASPYIFYQIWAFVAAGLYRHEKRYVHIFLPISLVLFWAGALLAFFVAIDYVLKFLFSFNRMLDIQAEPRISEWIGFVLFLPLGFGIAFQLPLVMFFLNRIGIFTVEAYLEKWRIAILVIFVISMLLTPADPISMLLMAAPLSGLYFLGVGMAKWMPRGKSPFGDPYDP